MALCYIEKRGDGSELGVWEITETEEQLTDLCAVGDEAATDLEQFGNEKRRKERLAVVALLQAMCGKMAQLGHDSHGRPFLQNQTAGLSIAHTRHFAVALMHPHKKVGVDMESLARDFSAVAQKALSPEERAYLLSDERERSLQLAIIWSAKEAIYKFLSIDGVDFSRQIKVSTFKPKLRGRLRVCFFDENEQEWEYFLQYKIVENHVLTFIVKDF